MENSEPPTSTTEILYKNEMIHQKCHDILISITSDVTFIFESEAETETDVIKISANKDVLATSSPVFKAMFYGGLKEEGDIKIVDVSSAAFREFLQFFYDYQVKLTMDNISDVLKLIDKYDVTHGYSICIDFLKQYLALDDIVWGLHLSLKFRLNELKNFCIKTMESNYETVFDKINFNDDGQICVPNHRLSEIDWETVLPTVFMASQSVIRNISDQLQNKRAIYLVKLVSAESSCVKLVNNETIVFSLDNPMLLTDIVCSNIFTYCDEQIERSFIMTIERKKNVSVWNSVILYKSEVIIRQGQNGFKLTTPLLIQSDNVYAINFKSNITTEGKLYYTNKSIVDKSVVKLAPNVNINFLGGTGKSLISVMYFTHLS